MQQNFLHLLKKIKRWPDTINFLLILILGLIPILQSGFTGFFNWTDTNAPARFSVSRFYDLLYLWHPFDAYFGKDISFYFTQGLPLQALWSTLIGINISPEIVQRIAFIISFSAMGWAMYFLTSAILKNYKHKRLAALLSALFFMYNPHTLGMIYYNSEIRLLLSAMIPLVLYIIIRCLDDKNNINKYIIISGLISIILFASGNLSFAILTLNLPIFYLIYYLANNLSRDNIKFITKFTLLSIFVSILLNLFWLLPIISNFNNISNQVTSIQETKNFITPIQKSAPNILSNLFLWRYAGGPQPNNTPYSSYYYSVTGLFIAIILIIIIYLPLFYKKSHKITLFFITISIFYVGLQSFIPNYLYNIWTELIKIFPLGQLFFVTILDRFGPIIMTCFSFLIAASTTYIFARLQNYRHLSDTKKVLSKFFIVIVVLLIFLNSWPILTWTLGERKAIEIPDYYNNSGKWLANQAKEFRIFSLPYHTYNLIYMLYDWQPYGSVDIIQQSGVIFHKPVIQLRPGDPVQPQIIKSTTNFLYNYFEINNIENNSYLDTAMEKILPLMNINYLLIREDVKENFIELSPQLLNNILEKDLFSEKIFKKLHFYKVNNFLPHFYTPWATITTSQNIDILPNIASQGDYEIRSAIYFNNTEPSNSVINQQSTSSKPIFDSNELRKKIVNNTPIIEFKKINPTKYRIIIHHATENFPLVFSESFHDGWKSYLINYKKTSTNFKPSDYKILDGNSDDQASTNELKNLISSGYISTLGNLKEKNIKHDKWENNREVFDYSEPYKIDFISKNFQDTIQNDNLAKGNFYETWLKEPINNNQDHLMVNGYANSWDINPNELCLNNAKCVKNADGSYDMELVIEFWPQRLFYIGLFISGSTLFGCLGYLGWDFIKRRKKKLKLLTN